MHVHDDLAKNLCHNFDTIISRVICRSCDNSDEVHPISSVSCSVGLVQGLRPRNLPGRLSLSFDSVACLILWPIAD